MTVLQKRALAHGAIFALASILTIGHVSVSCVSTPAGPRLAPDTEQGILTGEEALCDIVVGALWPAGVSACVGSERLLQAALDRVTATPDAGAEGQSIVPIVPLVHTLRGYEVRYRGRRIGYSLDRSLAVQLHSPQVTVALDAIVGDAGGGR